MRIRRKEILTRGGGMRKITPGGADNKYRKLRGLGEYSRKSKDPVRSDDKGEYP